MEFIYLFIFQVRTVLENPTRYHVIQKQKTQVRQYLSESFQQSEWENGSQSCNKDQMDYVRLHFISVTFIEQLKIIKS